MAGVDTSSYNLLQPSETPMQGAAGFLGLMQQGNQLKLQNANKLAGESMQQAIDPATGRVDPVKYNALIKANPMIARYAPQAIAAGQAIQGQDITNDTNAQALAHTRMDQIKGTLGSLITDPDVNWSKVASAAGVLVQNGVVPKEMVANFLSSLPQQGNDVYGKSMGDQEYAQALRQSLTNTLTQVMSSHDALSAVYPNPNNVTVNGPTGTKQVGVQASPLPGFQPRIVGGDNPMQDGGAAAPANGGAAAAPAAAAPAANAAQPTGTPQAVGPAWAKTTLPTMQTGIQGGAIQTALPKGVQETFDKSAAAYNDFTESMPSVAKNIYFMKQAKGALNDTTTGTNGDLFNAAKNFFVSTVGPDNLAKVIGDEKAAKLVNGVVNYEGFRKDMANVVQDQTTSGGTDRRLEQAIMGSPNEHLLNGTNKQLLQAMLGLQKMQQAKLQLFKQNGNDRQTWNDYAADFAKNVDPRAFAFDQLDKDQRQNLFTTLNEEGPSAVQQFKDSLNIALKTGVISKADLERLK